MTTWLLANVGNSDVQLPEQKMPARELAEYIAEHFEDMRGEVSVPLIAPTLYWLLTSQNASLSDLHIVLVATDQAAPPVTQERYWKQDTRPFAEMIQRLLTDTSIFNRLMNDAAGGKKHGITGALAKKQITIQTIDGSPADYNNLLDFFTGALDEIGTRVKEGDQIYLEVSGGTPAMTAMLILVGVGVFGEAAHTVYIEPGTPPYEMNVAAELHARQVRRDIRRQVSMIAYAVARRGLESSPHTVPDARTRDLVLALLDYGDRRLAFDFQRARAALQTARGISTGSDQTRIAYWLRQLTDPQVPDLLSELLHSLRIKADVGDYADFVQRVFRFQEQTFRYLAEQGGIQYGKSDEYASKSWLDAQPALSAFTDSYTPPGKKSPIRIEWARSLNRTILGAYVDYLIQSDPAQWGKWANSVTHLHRLSDAAELRNKGLSGHGFVGISREDVERECGMTIPDLLDTLRRVYADIFVRAPGDDPYQQLNSLIETLLKDSST